MQKSAQGFSSQFQADHNDYLLDLARRADSTEYLPTANADLTILWVADLLILSLGFCMLGRKLTHFSKLPNLQSLPRDFTAQLIFYFPWSASLKQFLRLS